MMIMGWCNVHTNEYDPQAKTYRTICTHHKLRNNNENKISFFSGMYMQQVTEYGVTNISGTKPRKNMTTMGKIDTSDLIMIEIWATDISFQSTKPGMGQLNTHNPMWYYNNNGRYSKGLASC